MVYLLSIKLHFSHLHPAHTDRWVTVRIRNPWQSIAKMAFVDMQCNVEMHLGVGSGAGRGEQEGLYPSPQFLCKVIHNHNQRPPFCSTFNLLPTLLMCHHSHYTGTYITDIRIQSNLKKIKLIRIHTHKYFKAFWIKKDSVIPLNLKTWTDERHTYHVCINVYTNFSTINIITL